MTLVSLRGAIASVAWTELVARIGLDREVSNARVLLGNLEGKRSCRCVLSSPSLLASILSRLPRGHPRHELPLSQRVVSGGAVAHRRRRPRSLASSGLELFLRIF